MQYFVNEIFVFDPTKETFFSHEEIVYKFSKGDLTDCTFSVNHIFNSKLSRKLSDEESKSDEKISSGSELFDFQKEFARIDQETQDPFLVSSIDKENFVLFLKIVNLKDYTYEYHAKEFISKILEAIIFPRSRLAAYFYFRNREYEIESGDLYGFDYMLYDKCTIPEETGLLNKTTHDHSKYAVVIYDEDSKQSFKFIDAHRLHRIAHQFNKVQLTHK